MLRSANEYYCSRCAIYEYLATTKSMWYPCPIMTHLAINSAKTYIECYYIIKYYYTFVIYIYIPLARDVLNHPLKILTHVVYTHTIIIILVIRGSPKITVLHRACCGAGLSSRKLWAGDSRSADEKNHRSMSTKAITADSDAEFSQWSSS